MTSELHRKIEELFHEAQCAEAMALLESECGANLPLIEKQGELGIERIRCAAVKLSEGSLDKLRTAVRLARNDWRDVLVAADFANSLTAHHAWLRGDRDT